MKRDEIIFLFGIGVMVGLILMFAVIKHAFGYEKTSCSPTPTPTPTVVTEDNDCLLPGQPDLDNSSDDVICTTPTPTEIPLPTPNTSTPNAGSSGGFSPSPQGNSSTTNPPAPIVCTISFDKPILNKFVINGDNMITFYWLESDQGVNDFSIIYGKSPNALIWGADHFKVARDADGYYHFPILVDTATSTWAQIYAWKNGCAEISNIFDPHK